MQGQLDDARGLLNDGLTMSLDAESTQGVTLGLAAFARLALVEGTPGGAAVALGAAEGIRRRAGVRVWRHFRRGEAELVEQLKHSLGADRFENAFTAGSGLQPARGSGHRPRRRQRRCRHRLSFQRVGDSALSYEAGVGLSSEGVARTERRARTRDHDWTAEHAPNRRSVGDATLEGCLGRVDRGPAWALGARPTPCRLANGLLIGSRGLRRHAGSLSGTCGREPLAQGRCGPFDAARGYG